jgi:hypothetical protein
MFEFIKNWGGLVGLLSGLFVLYDRFYKNRPVASLAVKHVDGLSKPVCIRIENTTKYDILVGSAFIRPNGLYSVGDDKEFLVPPDGKAELLIKAKSNAASDWTAKKRYVEFWVHWRRGNATWLPQIPIPVCSTTKLVRSLGDI